MAADPATAAWDNGAANGLDDLLARAFGIEDGYLELNGIVEQANYTSSLQARKFSLFTDLGLFNVAMKVVIDRLRAEITAAGEQRPLLVALFRALPGNFELRGWADVNLPDLLALVPQPVFEAARTPYETDRQNRRTHVLVRDLSQLAPKVALDNAGKKLVGDVVSRLKDLTGYKRVHDALHTLQMEVLTELVSLTGEQITPLARRTSMGIQITDMIGAADDIRQRFGESDAAPVAIQLRDNVVREIAQIAKLAGTLDLEKRETAETIAGLLRGLLRQQMSLFDSRLVEASEQIPFDRLAAMISGLAQPDIPADGAGGTPVLLDNVSSGFQDIAHRLAIRQQVHRLWQRAEATILNIEELLRGVGREIEIRYHWDNLEALVSEISTLSGETDLADFLKSPDLKLVLSEKVEEIRSESFRALFSGFVRSARTRFQRADKALLDDCDKLKDLIVPLQNLL